MSWGPCPWSGVESRSVRAGQYGSVDEDLVCRCMEEAAGD